MKRQSHALAGTPVVPVVINTAPGEFTLTKVNLVHAEAREQRIAVAGAHGTDNVVFEFCNSVPS